MVSAELATVGEQLARLEGRYDQLVRQQGQLEAELGSCQGTKAELEQTLAFLQTMEKEWRDRFQAGLGAVVSQGLSSVWQEDIEILLETTTFREATSIELMIKRGGMVSGVLDGGSGSIYAVLGFLLRVLLLISAQPLLRRVMILDEAFAHVSREYRPGLCELLTHLNAQLGMQFLVITHEPELLACAQLAYEVELYDGAARIKKILDRTEEMAL